VKVVASNKRARFDYEILEEIEAGIILTGQEVKSCRQGHVNLIGAYVSFLSGRPVLKNAAIQPYRFASDLASYDPHRDRELLLKGAEIKRLTGKTEERGLTILPLEMRAGRTIKVLLGLGKGRKKYEKRERIRERELKKRLQRGEEI
jgi:SsrA-binding protein